MKSFFKKIINKFKNIYFDIYLLLVVCSIFFLYILIHIDLFGLKYMIPIIIGLIILLLFNFFVLRSKKLKKKIKIVFSVLAVIISGVMIFGGITLHNIYSSVKDIFSNNSTVNYSVYVLDKSDYKKVNDLKDKIVGFYTDDKYNDLAEKKLNKKVSVQYVGYSSLEELTKALLNKEIDSIMLMDSYLDVLKNEENTEDIDSVESEFEKSSKVIYKFKLSIDKASESKKIDIENGSFAIYVSGQDSFADKVSDTSRSDVNLLMVVNLKSKQVLLVSIPRDYYVPIHGKGSYDKLTHVSLYGSETAAKTIGDMLDVNVDYFVKFNFTTFMRAINYFLPLDVYSDYNFTTSVYDQTIGTSYTFKEGFNHITTGEMALQFVRARKNFAEGDRQRGINQSRMLRAVIHKASSPSVLLKYNDILKSLDGTFLTNISNDSIIEIIKYLINNNGSFEISSVSLNGSDASRSCYSSGSTPLYVMIPNSKTVSEASVYIKDVLDGKKPDIETDASELADSSKTQEVTKIPYKPTYAPIISRNTPDKEKEPAKQEVIDNEPVVEDEEKNVNTSDNDNKNDDVDSKESGDTGTNNNNESDNNNNNDSSSNDLDNTGNNDENNNDNTKYTQSTDNNDSNNIKE